MSAHRLSALFSLPKFCSVAYLKLNCFAKHSFVVFRVSQNLPSNIKFLFQSLEGVVRSALHRLAATLKFNIKSYGLGNFLCRFNDFFKLFDFYQKLPPESEFLR